ncbi:MAG: zinc ribbon domain-containing protein, partial [Candidatus Parvarchaeota archaeon]
QIPVNGSEMTVHAVSNVNNVTIYEDVLNVEVPVIQETFVSQLVFPPSLVPVVATSLLGIYHVGIGFHVPNNVTIVNVSMVGIGSSYSNITSGDLKTFFFYTDFTVPGIVDKVIMVNGTIHGLPFSVYLTVPIKVGYPTMHFTYLSKHVVEYGTKFVEIMETNVNHTGTLSPVNVTLVSDGYSHTYTLNPDAQGIIKIPVPARFGIYTYTIYINYPSGFSHSTVIFRNVVTVTPLALTLDEYLLLIIAIVVIATYFVYRSVTPMIKAQTTSRTVKCNNCKRDVPFDADKCPYCGVKFTDKMYCGECGAEIPRSSDYCPICGNVFNKDIRLGEWLKRKYREYVDEQRKELEKIIGKIPDPAFWKMIIQGDKATNIMRFEIFRMSYILSGNFSMNGITVCPVCGSGLDLKADECPNCGVKTERVLEFFARVNESGSNVKPKKHLFNRREK